MSVFGNFTEAIGEILGSERASVNGFDKLLVMKLHDRLDIDRYGIVVEDVRIGDLATSLIDEAFYNAIPYVTGDACTITECDLDTNYDSRTWELAQAECRYGLCTKTATREFMAFFNRYKMVNPENSEYDFIVDRMTDILSDILANSLMAKIFLSDKSLASTDTLDALNGFLVQWESDTTRIVAIDEFLDGGVMTGESWYKAIKKVSRQYRKDKFTKKTFKDAIIIMDEDDANLLVDFLNDLGHLVPGDCTCYSADGIVRSEAFTLENLFIGGVKIETIPLKEMSLQFPELINAEEEIIRESFLVMTVRENNQVGTPKKEELEVSKVFYDNKDRKYYFDYGYQFGALVATPVYLYANVLNTAE